MNGQVKTKARRVMARAAAGLLLVLTLPSCASLGDNVLTYHGKGITEGEFQYYLATYKGRFRAALADFSDTADYYATPGEDGKTMGETLFDAAVDNVKRSLVCDALFDEMGLSLESSVKASVKDYLDDFIEEYSDGSRANFNAALAPLGINVKALETIYLRDEKAARVFAALYGANGETPLTDADRQAYLENNYVRVRHIYVNNKFVYSVDENGVQQYTEEGLRQTEPMTGDELAAKNELIAAIDESLADGGDFEEVYEAFSEDKYYENGYYLTRSTDFISDVVDSAFSLDVGDWVRVESDYGTHYILRLPMDESPWTDDANADFFEGFDTTVAEDLFDGYLREKIADVEVDETLIGGYSIAESPVNTRF